MKETRLFIVEYFPQKINEKPQVIADYECGKAIPNNQIMGKIERAIGKRASEPKGERLCRPGRPRLRRFISTGLKLRGKDIGEPLEAKPKTK